MRTVIDMIKGQNIALRMIEPTDLDELLVWENNQENWLISGTIVPFSRLTIYDYVHSAQDIYATRQLRLIIMDLKTKIALGAVDIFDFDAKNRKAGIGILVAEKNKRNQGIGKESLELVIQYAQKTLVLHQLYCSILEDNVASKKLFTSMGFKHVGTHKDWILSSEGWINEEMYQLLF